MAVEKYAGKSSLVLGLDIGTNSIGWALIREGKNIVASGVRVFEAGTAGTSASIAAGKDEPRGAHRRQARLARRMLARRALRLRRVFRLLGEAGLFPKCETGDPAERNRAIDALDERLRKVHLPQNDERSAHLLPYILRAKALDAALEPQALGRALYHLAQRRGFLSNRRDTPKPDEKPGEVQGGIETLAATMKGKGSRTLGEYFASLDPEAERIRKRWTSRRMYLDEFESIWKAQEKHSPSVLTPDFKRKLHQAIFFQRPLKSQKHLVGKCFLEPKARRAAWPHLDVQRFRLLQKVNDLRIVAENVERPLKPEERAALLATLEREGDKTFAAVRKLLKLPKGSRFNCEGGEEPKLPGNRTAARVGKVLGQRWNELSKSDRDAVVIDLLSIQNDDTLIRRAVKRWSLSEGQARELARVGLEDGYCAHSRKAIQKLLPRMEMGESYGALRVDKELFPRSAETKPAAAHLEPAPRLRNPIVERALTQLRKVVGAVIRAHGKPDFIRVELARDLKRPRKTRYEMTIRNRENQKQRDAAAEAIVKETGIKEPKRSDIEKYILAQECGWICPYTGASISINSLFGPSPQFDIEHVIPYSRCLDDSFLNKTLCHAAENRNTKGNKTPHEAYSGGQTRFDEILQRVKKFKGRTAKEKLRRFKMTPEEVSEAFAGFTSRHLQDTRYASVEAARYLGSLFGCRADQPGVDATGERRVQVSSGAVTAILRREWGFNAVLNDGGEKSRDDHRHHAVDALTTALAGPGIVQTLSSAAGNAAQARRRRFAPIEPPWPTLLEDARSSVNRIVVSHAVSRKVSGPLHEETLYSPPKPRPKGKSYIHVRKPLDKLTKSSIQHIVDPVVRETVRKHIESNGGDPKKAFVDGNHPMMPTRSGKRIPIHSARIRIAERPVAIGAGARLRHVVAGANHHVEIVENKDSAGQVKWRGEVVNLLEAARRLRAGEAVVKREHGVGERFVCSLANGDCFQYSNDGQVGTYIARSIWASGNIDHIKLEEARPVPELKKVKKEKKDKTVWLQKTVESLRKSGFKKVSVDPIGRIWPNNE